jgi:DNA-directed RNA polymerase subunit RPC12/RpoP
MGEYTTFVCRECGYTADRIRWGVSVNDPRKRFMPAMCVECKTIAEVDLTGADIMCDEFPCLKCGAEMFFLEKAQSYVCPKCKAKDMKLIQGEYW